LSTEVGTRRIVTEEGITNLLLCRDKDEREQAIRGAAGYTDVGRDRDAKMVHRLRERGVIRRPEDLEIDPLDADRNLLAAVAEARRAILMTTATPRLEGTRLSFR
jgi:hypothetical protein